MVKNRPTLVVLGNTSHVEPGNRLHVTRNDKGVLPFRGANIQRIQAAGHASHPSCLGVPHCLLKGVYINLDLGYPPHTSWIQWLLIGIQFIFKKSPDVARICGWRFFLDTKPAIYVLRRSEKIGYPPWHIQIRLAMLFPQTFCAFHLDAPSQLLLWGNNMVIQLRDITQAYIYVIHIICIFTVFCFLITKHVIQYNMSPPSSACAAWQGHSPSLAGLRPRASANCPVPRTASQGGSFFIFFHGIPKL